MTVTATQVARTPNEIAFLINHDGAAGDTLAIANSVLVASLEAGPLKELLENDDTNPLTQANARLRLLGQPAADTDLSNTPHAYCIVQTRDGADGVLVVDADEDAVTASRAELNVSATAALAANYILRLRFAHTLVT